MSNAGIGPTNPEAGVIATSPATHPEIAPRALGFPLRIHSAPAQPIAATAAIGWAGAEWIRNGKPSALGAISGCVAGLVAITPASGFVGPMPALFIGLIAGVGCYLMVAKVKAALGYDDSLDAFGVHGVGGTIGALLTGVFATRLINPLFKDAQGNALPLGMIDRNYGQIMNQALGVLIANAVAAVGTYII